MVTFFVAGFAAGVVVSQLVHPANTSIAIVAAAVAACAYKLTR